MFSVLLVVLVWVLARSTSAPAKPPALEPATEAVRTASGGAEPTVRQGTTREIVARNVESVALVSGKLGSGTGFIVAPGILATNAHVIGRELPSNVTVAFAGAGGADHGPFPVKLLYEDARRDLALLQVGTRLRPLDLARSYTFQRGDDITVIGNPGSLGGEITLENAVSRGVLSTETAFAGLRYYQLGISINPGNSGGPVFDSTGRVIGVVVSKSTAEEQQSFCIPVADLLSALDSVRDITSTQIARVDKRHAAQSSFRILKMMGENYYKADLIQGRIFEAKAKKENASTEVAETYKSLENQAQGFDLRVRADYFGALQRVLDDPATDPSVAKDLLELRRLVNQLKDLDDHPESNTLDQYIVKVLASKKALDTLCDRLNNSLDVPR